MTIAQIWVVTRNKAKKRQKLNKLNQIHTKKSSKSSADTLPSNAEVVQSMH